MDWDNREDMAKASPVRTSMFDFTDAAGFSSTQDAVVKNRP